MLEIILSSVLQAVAPTVIEEALEALDSAVGNRPELSQVREDFDEIRRELDSMHAFLMDADEITSRSNSMDAWVKQVRDSAYKVEDVVDEFLAWARRRQARGGLLGSVDNATHYFSENIRLRSQFANRLQSIKAEIRDVSERKERYNLQPRVERRRADGGRRAFFVALPPPSAGDELMGIERNKDLLVEWLTNEDERRMVISVCGRGGIGKTTLVAEAYEHQRTTTHFKHRAWVSVSQFYNVQELLIRINKRLLENADKDIKTKKGIISSSYGSTEQSLIRGIREFLDNKRYLIVLDYVWSVKIWHDISSAFPTNSCGSRIVLTTQDEVVAGSLADRNRVLNLESLNGSVAWSLFCKKAFGSEECPEELKKWAENFVEKCEGLPLAIVSIAGAMSLERRAFEWKKTYESISAELNSNPMLQPMKRIMMLSFNNLPYHLKQCFLFCSLFPEGHSIKTKWVVRLWTAEGFVNEEGGRTMEEVAEKYLEELGSRSMLQVGKRNEVGGVKAWRMHDLMRELALDISKREDFSAQFEGEGSTSDGKFRHLSIHRSITRVGKNTDLSRVRSLLVFVRGASFSLTFPKLSPVLKLLRVLDLQGAPIDDVPDEVFDLFNLRYLSLRETKVSHISRSLKRLQLLQTFDIWKTGVKELPRGIVKLQNLRHLFMDEIDARGLRYRDMGGMLRGTEAPRGLWDLRMLQTLRNIQANEQLVAQLGKLTQLRRLGITKLGARHGIHLCNSISKMGDLLRLSIKAATGQQLNLESSFRPPTSLQKLKLKGGLDGVPKWFGLLKNLTHMYLFDTRLREGEDPIPLLQGLPELVLLALDEAYEGRRLCFPSGSFGSLKTLCLKSLKQLRQLEIEEDALPSLRVFYLYGCGKLERLPKRLENDSGLLDVYLRDMPGLHRSKLTSLQLTYFS